MMIRSKVNHKLGRLCVLDVKENNQSIKSYLRVRPVNKMGCRRPGQAVVNKCRKAHWELQSGSVTNGKSKLYKYYIYTYQPIITLFLLMKKLKYLLNI